MSSFVGSFCGPKVAGGNCSQSVAPKRGLLRPRPGGVHNLSVHVSTLTSTPMTLHMVKEQHSTSAEVNSFHQGAHLVAYWTGLDKRRPGVYRGRGVLLQLGLGASSCHSRSSKSALPGSLHVIVSGDGASPLPVLCLFFLCMSVCVCIHVFKPVFTYLLSYESYAR